jgi:hypothetical protein
VIGGSFWRVPFDYCLFNGLNTITFTVWIGIEKFLFEFSGRLERIAEQSSVLSQHFFRVALKVSQMLAPVSPVVWRCRDIPPYTG